MNVAVPRESHPAETRVAATPASVERLVKLGLQVRLEKGAGERSRYPDEAYTVAGAALSRTLEATLEDADVVLRVQKPRRDDLDLLKRGCVHVSHLNPFQEKDLVLDLAGRGVSVVSLEMIPRTTRAQKMDALSSQASLAGYVAAVMAAERLAGVFPMMVTPAGTLQPARVFVMGAGVAGLQAIATARRLGAVVDAYDPRPAAEEEVRSLGARFVKVDLGQTGQTQDGYAKALSAEQLETQRKVMTRYCAGADVVITAAQVFGRKAPILVTAPMLAGMKKGSVVVDLAVDSGGNVEGATEGEMNADGVLVVSYPSLARRVPVHASQMYASNLASFLETYWDRERHTLVLKPEDEILSGCLLTRDGEILNRSLREVYAA